MSRIIRAIIVDDFIYDLKYLGEMICWSDYDIEIMGMFENGKEALEFIKVNRIDLVISDIQMSELDGFELAKVMKENFPQTKVVFISCHNDFAYAKEAVNLNVSAYITKPFVKDDVMNTIEFIANTIKCDNKENTPQIEMAQVLSTTPQIQATIKSLIVSGNTQGINEFIISCICRYTISPLRKYIKPNAFMMATTMESCVLELGGELSDILGISGDYWGIINGFNKDDEVINWVAQTLITARYWYVEKQKDEQETRVHKIKELIDGEYDKELTVKYIADKLFLSPNYTNSVFKAEMDLSIPEYLVQVRIEKAKELLVTTNQTISSVVEAVGYKHAHNFNKLFVGRVGCSLGEYRKKAKKF